MPTRLIGEKVTGRIEEVICITELQWPGSLCIVRTKYITTMHTIEVTQLLPKMLIEVERHKENVTAICQIGSLQKDVKESSN